MHGYSHQTTFIIYISNTELNYLSSRKEATSASLLKPFSPISDLHLGKVMPIFTRVLPSQNNFTKLKNFQNIFRLLPCLLLPLLLQHHIRLLRLQSSCESRLRHPLSLLGNCNQYGDTSGVLPCKPLCRADRDICK